MDLIMVRSFLRNLMLLASALLICLVLAELFFRVWPQFMNEEAALRLHWRKLADDARHQDWALPDSHFGFRYRPNVTGDLSRRELAFSFTTDENGFRNASPWPEQADIVVVGDSTAFGHGVDDELTWVRLVADEMPEARIINLGLIGAGPEQYLRVLQSFGLQLDPKLVLFMLFPGNDLVDADTFQQWLDAGRETPYKEWRITHRAPSQLGSLRRLLEGSYLFAFLRGAYRSLASPIASSTIEVEDGSRLQLVPAIGWSNAEFARPGHPVFELVMTTIEHARTLSSRHGSRFLVLLMPTKEEVYLPLAGQLAPPLVESFRTALQERDIPSLDLTPEFREQAASGAGPLFFEVDGHPNGAGYRLIARVVADHLRRHAQRYGIQG